MEDKDLSNRVIAYFDVDCFYAQAEVLHRPHLKDRPVGITQKFLVVTSNYVARNLGVPKMVPIQEAKRRCPDLVLLNGEDLTPYRAASKMIMAVLRRFGTLERRGLDEAALDITVEVLKRSTSNQTANSFSGHVLGLDDNNLQSVGACTSSDFGGSTWNIKDYLLMVGSELVAEIRAAVEKETGFRCSCGIANNKMLAKLVCAINKPDKQTSILGSAVLGFLQTLPVRKIPGVGHQTESLLKEIGVETVADLQKLNMQQLSCKFGDRLGIFLYNSSRGIDHTLVQDKGPPKSLSVEDSFRSCTSLKHVEEILRNLAPDLVARLDEDKEETGRRPKVFNVKWRHQGSWNFTSSSAPMPIELLSTALPSQRRMEMVVEVAMKLILHNLGASRFSLVVLNIGATNFVDSCSGNLGASQDIRSFLHSPSKSCRHESKVLSKREARIAREVFEREKGSLFDSEAGSLVTRDSEGKWASQSSPQPHDDQNQDCLELQMGQLSGTSSSSHLSDEDVGLLEGESETCTETQVCQLTGHFNYSEERGSMEATAVNKKHFASAINLQGTRHNDGMDLEAAGVRRLSHGDSQSNQAGFHVLGGLGGFVEITGASWVRQTEFHSTHPFDHEENEMDDKEGVTPNEERFCCNKCGQQVGTTRQARLEHDDYHFALDLQAQESRISTALPPVANTGKNKSKVSNHSSLSSKKMKSGKGPLDSFLSRS